MSARNLKLRAIENGVYDKFHLTRTRFEVPPDLMTTDMGNSYLALRTTLRDSITHLIVDTQQSQNEIPLFFCLGDGATAYDGTCLFRTAKLFNKATGAVIEELNYNNLRTNTFKELCNDFDNLASDTIETGLGIPDSKLPNLQSTYTLWTNATNNMVELHIPLKSIFPSLNTPYFQLSAVGGLLVDLEWDTTHPLVMSYSNPELVIPPPQTLASGFVGFNTVEQEEASWLVREQINSQFAPIEKPFAVERPEYWEFPRVDADVPLTVRYWKSLTGLVYGLPDGAGNYAGVQSYEWADERKDYTNADIVQLTILPTTGVGGDANYFAEVHSVLLGAGDDEYPFTFASQIEGESLTAGLTFTQKHECCRLGVEGIVDARLDAVFSPLTNPDTKGTNPTATIATITTSVAFQALKDTHTIEITPTTEQFLLDVGILFKVNGVAFADENTTFTLYLQNFYNGGNDTIYMCPDLEAGIGGFDFIITNQKFQVPYLAPQRLNVELYTPFGNGGGTITFSQSLRLNGVIGVRPAHGFYNLTNVIGADPRDIIASSACVLFFQDIQYERPVVESLPHYPSCDLAEMVLVQYPPSKSPMPKFYRTMKVEPFVIPDGMNEIVQNFMLEPNTYNSWILIPYDSENEDVSLSPSLISGDGNVLKFRATIDEVDVVNKDIGLGQFPDSLYWDKLADAFSNSAMPMKTLTGTVSGATQRPVRVFPVRIYGGLVNGVVSFSNFMKRLQIRLEAPQGETVRGGTAYLYKELYKGW